MREGATDASEAGGNVVSSTSTDVACCSVLMRPAARPWPPSWPADPAGPAGAAQAQGQDLQPYARAGRGGHRRRGLLLLPLPPLLLQLLPSLVCCCCCCCSAPGALCCCRRWVRCRCCCCRRRAAAHTAAPGTLWRTKLHAACWGAEMRLRHIQGRLHPNLLRLPGRPHRRSCASRWQFSQLECCTQQANHSRTSCHPSHSSADPTAIEAEVRKQMAERQAAHEDRNLARMLTPAERRWGSAWLQGCIAWLAWRGPGLVCLCLARLSLLGIASLSWCNQLLCPYRDAGTRS